MIIKIKKVHPDAKLPSYAHIDDAGLDMFAQEDYVLKPGERRKFDTGFALEFPDDYVALVWDKGSMSYKNGIHIIGGVYDAGYRGEYNAVLINLSDQKYEIKKGDKIAQLLIQPVVHADLEEVEELSQTARGAGQFGSTGRQ